jgi:hypothetical protein
LPADGGATAENAPDTKIAHNDCVTCCRWASADTLFTASLDGSMFVWRMPAKGAQLVAEQAMRVPLTALPRALRASNHDARRSSGVTVIGEHARTLF